MEIERKWLVDSWPEGLIPETIYQMEQGYLTTSPTVRIRRETSPSQCEYILCLKGKSSADGLARQEIELTVTEEVFSQIRDLIGKPLIAKERRDYRLASGLRLEVSQVDAGQPTGFFYAEVEYPTEEAARAWKPEDAGLSDYLTNEVTGQPGVSMGAYWRKTRGFEI